MKTAMNRRQYGIAGRRNDAMLYLLLFSAAFAMKWLYSRAGSDDLLWILAPTARMAEMLGGMQFAYETATGFVDRSRGIIIAPGCAGVNFMIMAFGVAGWAGLRARAGIPCRLVWLSAAAAGAYLSTLAANTLRIVGAVYLYRAGIYGAWVTPERIHRLLGIVVYLPLLFGIHVLAERAIRYRFPGENQSGALRPSGVAAPVAWYLTLTIGVPVLNGALAGTTRQFIEHCATILAATAIALGIGYLIKSYFHKTPAECRYGRLLMSLPGNGRKFLAFRRRL